MRYSEHGIEAGINSEIHASLRRLEDANYISESIQDEKLSTLANQVESKLTVVNSKINKLNNEVYQLHSYIEPHIYNGDLQFFQTLYVGNLQVDGGGSFSGAVTFNNGITVNNALLHANAGVDTTEITVTQGIICEGSFSYDSVSYGPHSLTIEGTELSGSIFSDQDMSFSLVGLVEGSASGDTLTIRTKKNHVSLMGITVTPNIQYNPSTHKYRAWAVLKDSDGGSLLVSSNEVSETEAYIDGKNSVTPRPPKSTTFSYFETVNGENHYKVTGGASFGTTTRVVYWG